jgi:hypothetical protein
LIHRSAVLRTPGNYSIEARSPSGKAEVCKTSIGGSIPPRASNIRSGFVLPM